MSKSLFEDLNISKLLFKGEEVGGREEGGAAARICGREKEDSGILGELKVGEAAAAAAAVAASTTASAADGADADVDAIGVAAVIAASHALY